MEDQSVLAWLLSATVGIGLVASLIYYLARFVIRSPHLAEDQSKFDLKSDSTTQEQRFEAVSVQKENSSIEPIDQLESALVKTKTSVWGRIKGLFGAAELPSDLQDQIEESLYIADLGVATVERLMLAIKEESNRGLARGMAPVWNDIRERLKKEMVQILSSSQNYRAPLGSSEPVSEYLLRTAAHKTTSPQVWLIVGVNGAGKTTTIGKLAYSLANQGQKVLVAAGDTFRAAAGEQLKVWSERAQVEIFSPSGITDPAAVAYQAVEKAKALGVDVVLVDTAGRLHTQKNLMEELKKVKRVIAKIDEAYPCETLLVLDANSGQNALVQAREFHQALDLTGVVLTKMDGSAKGGVALSLAVELQLSPRLIGVGEKVSDLRPFVIEDYVNAII